MKTIEQEKEQAFDNFAVTCAIACSPIEEYKIPFQSGFDAGVNFVMRWIPVEVELPETNCDVIVKKRNGITAFMSYHAPFDSGKRSFHWWGFGSWINQDNQVTHWRPIERQ